MVEFKSPPDPSGVTVAIMARNEQPLVARLTREVQPYAEEVMLIDGHSTDGTREAAQAAGVRVVLDGGKGKGDGIRTAINHANTPLLVLMDCDGSHEAEYIPSVVAPLREDRLWSSARGSPGAATTSSATWRRSRAPSAATSSPWPSTGASARR